MHLSRPAAAVAVLACAAGIALGVLQPDLVNVAGVAPILIRLGDGRVESIAGLGWWPKSLPADLFMREHGGKIPDGPGAFYPATVLTNVAPGQPAYDEELFGPVASVIRAKDDEDDYDFDRPRRRRGDARAARRARGGRRRRRRPLPRPRVPRGRP